MSTGFLAVDLEIASETDLDGLRRSWPSEAVFVLYCGLLDSAYRLHVQRTGSAGATVDDGVRHALELVDLLTEDGRAEWARATERTFNIGVHAATATGAEHRLSAETMRRLVAVGATVAITVYRDA